MDEQTLIDKAIEVLGSQGKLARAIGAQQSHVSEWRSGARRCPEEKLLAIARVTQADPVGAVLEVVRSRLGKLVTTSLAGLAVVVTSLGFGARDAYALAAVGPSRGDNV